MTRLHQAEELPVAIGGLYQGEGLRNWQKVAQFEGDEEVAVAMAMAHAELAAKRDRDSHPHGWGKPWAYGYRNEKTGLPTLMLVTSETINLMQYNDIPVGVPVSDWNLRPKVVRQPKYTGPLDTLDDFCACLKAYGFDIHEIVGDDEGIILSVPDGGATVKLSVDPVESKLTVEAIPVVSTDE